MLVALVSVIIPAFNAASYISDAIGSALAQSYRELEILVIDDGSTDATSRLVTEAAALDGRLRLVTTPNRGVARARNLGLELAKGDYVAFLDADDLWHREKVSTQIESLESLTKDWAACYSLHRNVDKEGKVRSSASGPAHSGFMLARHLYSRAVGNGSSLLVRTEAARGVGGFDPTYLERGIGGCEDFDFELRLASRFQIVGLTSYLVGYRWHDANMSNDRPRMARAMLATTSRHLAMNERLPKLARKYAMAAAYDFAMLMYLRHLRLPMAGWSFLRLCGLDFRLALYRLGWIMAWLAKGLRHRLADEKWRGPGSFLNTPPVSGQPHSAPKFILVRLATLGRIDAALWADMRVGASEPNKSHMK